MTSDQRSDRHRRSDPVRRGQPLVETEHHGLRVTALRRIELRARMTRFGRLLTDWPVLPVLTHQRQTMRSLAAGRERAWPTFERPLFFGSSHVLMRRDAGTTHRACAAANAWSRGPLGEFSQGRSRVARRIPELAVGA